MRCNALPYVAMCCNVLRYVAMHCNMQQIHEWKGHTRKRIHPPVTPVVVMGCAVLQRVATCCNVLQRVATCCNGSRCVAVCCRFLNEQVTQIIPLSIRGRTLWRGETNYTPLPLHNVPPSLCYYVN